MEDDKKKEGESVETRKKKNTKEKVYNNRIEVNPKLEEAPSKTAVVGWGRMNPITSGHEKLVNKIKEVARSEGAFPVIYLTHSQDAKKNPLSYDDKVMLARKAFGNIIQKSKSKTIIQVMQELQRKYNKVILVVGADRISEFETLLNRYNGKDYSFDSIDVVSAGERTDPDSDDAKQMTADTMSASVMRKLASEGDFDTFKKGLPSKLVPIAQDVYDMVRGGMKIAEALELDEAVLDRQARRQRAITMRRYKSKIAAARKRAMRKAASQDVIEKRARKKAIKIVRKKVAAQQGADYNNLDVAQRMIIDKKVAKRKAVIDRITKKLLPKVRQAERARRAGKSGVVNEQFEAFFEATEVRQDPHIKDRKGTQPAVYHKGLSKSTKEKRDAHFKKGAKMDDDNPAAYKPAPGDAEAKTKESQYTKKYKQMYGEESAPTKRFHELRKKDGSIKLDGRFRAFKKKPMQEETPLQAAEKRLRDQHKTERENLKREHESEMDAVKTRGLQRMIRKINTEEVNFENDVELLAMIEEVSSEIHESILLDEEKAKEGLKAKAEKSGISYGILKKVFDRGVAAWRTGHRPGTTPQQWGYARVNSFITGGKTRTTADADLWKQHKGVKEETEMKEGLWDNIRAKRARIKAGSGERMRKPGSKGAPTAQNFKDASEAVSPAQQAAIAIAKKKKAMQEEIEFFTLDEQFEMQMLDEEGILDKALAAIHKHVSAGKDLGDMSYQVSRAAGVNFSGQELRRKYIEKFGEPNQRKANPEVRARLKRKFGFKEEHGAGDRGTPQVTKRYKKDTPGEDVNESFEEHLMEAKCDLIGMKQIKEFEKLVDRLFEKFGIDFQFTKHFGERMSDERNNPCITLKELADFMKKIYMKQGKSLKGVAGAEAVIKDIQTDLNIPVAVKYDQRNDEFDVVMKTIMRKKNFMTSNQVIKY